jgi:hypothetical protein
MKFAYAYDATSGIARAFGATRTPEAFLFDASGKLVYHGTIDDNADDATAVKDPYLANAVNAVAGGKAVPVAETKALGCGIKFRKSSAKLAALDRLTARRSACEAGRPCAFVTRSERVALQSEPCACSFSSCAPQ